MRYKLTFLGYCTFHSLILDLTEEEKKVIEKLNEAFNKQKISDKHYAIEEIELEIEE